MEFKIELSKDEFITAFEHLQFLMEFEELEMTRGQGAVADEILEKDFNDGSLLDHYSVCKSRIYSSPFGLVLTGQMSNDDDYECPPMWHSKYMVEEDFVKIFREK